MLIRKLPLVLIIVLLAGCNGKEQAETKAREIVIGVGRDFYNGPDSGSFLHGSTGVWESLTYLDENLEPKPQLAEKFVPDDTGKVWIVSLRQGIRFHDGTPLNSEAVIKSVNRLQRSVKLDEYGTFLSLEKVEAVSDKEVKFTFKKPEPAFPAKAAYHGCPIFSPKSFDESGKITNPYGSGPFKFSEYKKGESLVLIRNDDYWGGKAKLTKVTFKVIPDPATRLAALQNGEIQSVVDVGGLLPEQAPAIEKDTNLSLRSRPVTTTHYLLFNNKKQPFDDRKLRQAVSLSLDRPQLVEKLLNGYGESADTMFSPLAKTWVVKGLWTTDENKAKEMSKQITVGRSQKLVFIVNSSLANRWPYKSIAEIIQANLKTLGFDTELKMMENAAWKEAVKKGQYDLTLSPYTLMTGDPDFFFSQWLYSKGQMNLQRGIGYSNLAADRLVEAAGAELDIAKRQQYYRELQQLAAQDVPLSPLYHDVCLFSSNKKVVDLEIDPFFKPSLETAMIVR
ncbi:extracellular solute-binding protein family 5 [Desulfofarcimen acetoxidans DSM 771]|uniref:Extracellular solute-binding protein family 5 n=1 Tax=Desulfofarcimen acetoxidans (strain ATCC 49208 / DSM 771 / KCTC 5769 / VKM B-1644 / 5575) TaxID=485916 RepID=C8W4W0_DESAS|nr:ABC transporter substrate-binding protein [Desulfofarcimen acetoxidans]ACV61312.1 extracellular solute-binding protein family 5 [Desulfofarcimen acetoxidans DSM 771]